MITGGSSGLGKAFCEELGKKKARILIGDLDTEGAEVTAELVRSKGGDARVVACDVRDPKAVEGLADTAKRWFGDTDLLINNAGVAVSGPVGEVPLEDWRWVLDINLWGVIYGCHIFAPRMKARRNGYIINVASAAGLVSAPEMAPYCVSKAGVVALSETMYAELRPLGVRVTVLCPTFFATGILDAARQHSRRTDALEVAKAAMKNSKVQANDVARAALKCSAKGELYALPMRDGRVLWRLKRANPTTFATLMTKAAQNETAMRWLRK